MVNLHPPTVDISVMDSLSLLVLIYTSDVYKQYHHRYLAQIRPTYYDKLLTLQQQIKEEIDISITVVDLLMIIDKGVNIHPKAIQLLDDETLLEFIGKVYTLSIHDTVRRQFVTVYLARLINDNGITYLIQSNRLTPEQDGAYTLLTTMITGTVHDQKYVNVFKRTFDA